MNDKPDLPPGMIYRTKGDPPEWRFSSRSERKEIGSREMIALDPQRVINGDRLEEFYRAWVALRKLAERLSIDVHIRPEMLIEEVERRESESYEHGLTDGSNNPNKYSSSLKWIPVETAAGGKGKNDLQDGD